MSRRILSLLLALALCLSLAPAAGAAEAGQTDGVWAAIEALEQQELPDRPTAADCERLLPQVEALVTAREDYIPGSGTYKDGVFRWRTADGTACGYDPELRTRINSAVPMPEADRIAAEREADRIAAEREADRAADLSGEETAVLMSGDAGSKDVAVFIPWWGEDNDFLLTIYYLGVQLADAMGGSCKRYLGKEATLDELANALTTCRMVFIHTHGGDGTVTLLSDKGITSQDYEDYHVTQSGSGIYSVDGQAILNHLNGPVVTDYFSMNSCLGMAAERMEAPLREAGVKAVFGFSQSVTFAYDITYTRFLISGLLQGKTIAEAVSEAHRQIADFVLEWFRTNEALAAMLKEKGAIYWDPWKGNGASTPEQARENKAAFPILVSEQDPYPGLEHKDEIQDVKCTWKVPFDPEASRDLRAWGTVGRVFASFFPDAREITLLEGSLPPGINISVQKVQWLSVAEGAPGFYGTPTQTGLYEAKVNVTLASEATETRWARFVIAGEEITQSQEELVAQPGQDQTLAFYNGHSGEIFQVEQLNGTIPPGMTMFSDGGRPRLCGTPMQTGRFSAAFRIVLSSGKVIDHTVNVTVPAKYGVSSETISLFVGEENRIFLNFEGSDQVRNMECIRGELPSGVSFRYSMSEAPNYTGTPQTVGTYPAVFRVSLLNGKTVTHMVTAVVLNEAPSIPVYTMDLSLGGTSIPGTDMDTWLSRSLTCADQANQIWKKTDENGVIWLDLDRNGSQDIAAEPQKDGTVTFRQLEGCSLSAEDYSLALSADAIAKANALWESDPSARYAKEIVFHLKDSYDLYIAGTQVNSRNREDILGNGVFSFDGVNTLFVHGDFNYTGSKTLIRNGIDGLTVRTESDSSLSCWGSCIETTGSLSLTGAGQLNLQSSENSGIVCEKALLEIYNTTLMIQAKKKGITGIGEAAVHARADRANVSVRSGEGAMDGFWSIGLTNCMVTTPVRGDKGAIGGLACLVGEEGELLKEARITAYQKKYGLTIDGIPVTDRNRNDVLRDGTFSFDGDHTLTISKSYEDAKNVIVDSRIDGLVICAAPDTVLQTSKMICLSLNGNTILTGGPLKVVSESILGRGILLDDDVSLLVSDMTLTVQGSKYGILGAEGTGKLVLSDSTVSASGGTAAIKVPGGLERCMVETPENGRIQSGTVVDSAGNSAKEAVLRFFKEYDLMIDGIPVTSQNMNDLGPSFSFDGGHTLTIHGDYRSEYNIIENGMDGLVVYVESDAVLSTEPDYEWSMPFGTPLFTKADMTITGPGKLTLRGGINHGFSAAYGAAVTLKDANLDADTIIGVSDGTSLVLDKATVVCGMLTGFDGGITLTGCGIAAPAGGKVKGGSVVGPDETTAADVVIAPMEVSVSGETMTYSLYLPGSGESARLIAAWYDENGKMLGCTAKTTAGSGHVTGTVTVEKGQKEYRLFALDGESAKPLIRALTTG